MCQVPSCPKDEVGWSNFDESTLTISTLIAVGSLVATGVFTAEGFPITVKPESNADIIIAIWLFIENNMQLRSSHDPPLLSKTFIGVWPQL
jgi:hypothetical protein